jgi:hypothetical protein
VKFVVDVDNIGSIEGIIEYFRGYDVVLHFFVKNNVELKVPEYEDSMPSFSISLVGSSDDDDDAAALIDAINRDCFIISRDKYQTYIRAGLTDENWLESHRIPCTSKMKFGNDVELGSSSDKRINTSKLIPTIPMHLLPLKNNSESSATQTGKMRNRINDAQCQFFSSRPVLAQLMTIRFIQPIRRDISHAVQLNL